MTLTKKKKKENLSKFSLGPGLERLTGGGATITLRSAVSSNGGKLKGQSALTQNSNPKEKLQVHFNCPPLGSKNFPLSVILMNKGVFFTPQRPLSTTITNIPI